ncbi:hypothetical protein [Streptomyces sp. NBRC 110465]|uniref:hypothetical protein n=1 Tax=Streptomyces sp. NBRC 110465 TaxID=1897621 RepID=UPI0009342C9F|nr:hypothetical protein [Streptomyces sp. NBRC 110465]
MDGSVGDAFRRGLPRQPFAAAARPVMEFVAARSVDDLALAARCIRAGDIHLAVQGIRRTIRLIDFAGLVVTLGREFPEGRRDLSADGSRTLDDSPPATSAGVVGGGGRVTAVADPGTLRSCPSTGRETDLLRRLRQVAAELWESFGGAVEAAGVQDWEVLDRLTERLAPAASRDGRLVEAAEIYRALVELNAAALRWERIHWCDWSSGNDSWCEASGISPLFPMLPPAPGMPVPAHHRGATSW